MNCAAPSLLRRSLTLLMVGLLALGPFLHSHFGTSHDTGFHLDGVHAVHAPAAAGMNALQASNEESPALGVAASLPQPEDEGLVLFGLALLVTALPLLPRRHLPLPRVRNRGVVVALRDRPGLPPPGLAPPIA